MTSDDIPPPPDPASSPTSPPPPLGYEEAAPGTTKDDRLWGMLAHLTAISGLIGVPFGHILGPMIVYFIKKDGMPFVEDQTKESMNFQITMTIAAIVSGILIYVCIGFFLLIGVAVVDLVFIIIASIAANRGERYRYPFAIRLVQ